MIVNGKIRMHDGDSDLKVLSDREAFGELSVLSSEPRPASATAVEDTTLYRLDQDILYELMAEKKEVAQSLIQILTERFR